MGIYSYLYSDWELAKTHLHAPSKINYLLTYDSYGPYEIYYAQAIRIIGQ